MTQKPEPLKGKVKIYELEVEISKLFIEAWKEKSEKDYVDSLSVMEFAKFIVRRKNEDIKSAVQGLLKEIEQQDNKVTKMLSEILQGKKREKAVNRGALYGWREALVWIKELIKKWFPDICKGD